MRIEALRLCEIKWECDMPTKSQFSSFWRPQEITKNWRSLAYFPVKKPDKWAEFKRCNSQNLPEKLNFSQSNDSNFFAPQSRIHIDGFENSLSIKALQYARKLQKNIYWRENRRFKWKSLPFFFIFCLLPVTT